MVAYLVNVAEEWKAMKTCLHLRFFL